MKLNLTKKKFVAFGLAAGIAAGAGGIAAAFVATTGSGTGTASGPTAPVSLLLSSTGGALTFTTPMSIPVSYRNLNPYSVKVTGVHVTKITATTNTSNTATSCNTTTHPTWFTINNTTPGFTAAGKTSTLHTLGPGTRPVVTLVTSTTTTQKSCTNVTFHFTLSAS